MRFVLWFRWGAQVQVSLWLVSHLSLLTVTLFCTLSTALFFFYQRQKSSKKRFEKNGGFGVCMMVRLLVLDPTTFTAFSQWLLAYDVKLKLTPVAVYYTKTLTRVWTRILEEMKCMMNVSQSRSSHNTQNLILFNEPVTVLAVSIICTQWHFGGDALSASVCSCVKKRATSITAVNSSKVLM